ncbi:adenylate kinase [uncultured Bradyrhizobium sp.]|uniref:adenylate kinase n=1 Tax=uncultured Bradyrhizobium sp. TaxID=199684 RepID=UPI0035CBB7C7
MARIVVIGNAAGGKSTLARHLARRRALPLIEVDRLLWQPGWRLTSESDYRGQHADILARERWVIDGLGRQDSIAERLARSTEIVLIDMALWMHFALAAERQIAWSRGRLDHPPAGAAEMPPTAELFRTMWEVERSWMPDIRRMCAEAELEGKAVTRLASVAEIDSFVRGI